MVGSCGKPAYEWELPRPFGIQQRCAICARGGLRTPGRIVLVYDQLRVKRIELKRDRGGINMKWKGDFRIGGIGDWKGNAAHEKLRWELTARRGVGITAAAARALTCPACPPFASWRATRISRAERSQLRRPETSSTPTKHDCPRLGFLFDPNDNQTSTRRTE